MNIEGAPKPAPIVKPCQTDKTTETISHRKITGEISIQVFRNAEERKLVPPILSWKNTTTDPLVIEPKIVEVIKEVQVEVVKTIVKEPDMVPVEKMSQGTNTEQKPKPIYIINSISEQHRAAPVPVPRIQVSAESQTQTFSPKLEIQAKTSEFHLKPRSAAMSPVQPAAKVFNFKYEGSAKSSQGSNQTSPAVDKLERRLKIYEDQNVKLQMEIDSLKSKHSGLYSKLSEKTFESSGQFHAQIELLKKDNVQLKGLLDKMRAEASKIKDNSDKESKLRIVI